MYAGVAYGFWTEAYVSTRGNKSKLKVGCSLHFPFVAAVVPCRIGVHCTERAYAALRVFVQSHPPNTVQQDICKSSWHADETFVILLQS